MTFEHVLEHVVDLPAAFALANVYTALSQQKVVAIVSVIASYLSKSSCSFSTALSGEAGMWSFLRSHCWQVQYDDGDQEIGAAFQRYSLEQGPAGQQVVKVHEFKPGNYKPQAEHVEGNNTATTSTAKQSAEDMPATGEA